MTTALVFEKLHPASTTLVFGDDFVAPNVDITLTGTLPGLTATIRLMPPVEVTITGALPALTASITLRPSVPMVLGSTLPGLTLTAQVTYHSNTARPDVYQAQAFAAVAVPVEAGITNTQDQAINTNTGIATGWQEALYLAMSVGVIVHHGLPTVISTGGRFEDGVKTRSGLSASMQEGVARQQRYASGFEEASRVPAIRLESSFQDGYRDRRPNFKAYFEEAARRAALQYTGHGQYAQALVQGRAGRFQEARRPPAGRYVAPPDLPLIPNEWGTALVFACPPLTLAHLVFGLQACYPPAPGAPFQILPARFYMTAHTIYAQTLPGLVDVPIFEATVSADAGSYCWSLSATGPASLFEQLAKVDGLPAQIKLMLDGLPWVFAVDSLSRSITFGKSSVRVQGRSLTALIAAPYLRSTTRGNEFDRTAQQLGEDALTGCGIALDWGTGAGALSNGGMIDWLVPAGAWSHQGTPLDALQAIVQAAGGYLQSHRSAATLLARHPYGQRVGDTSGAPWGWDSGAADVELAPDALITSSIARHDGPDINAVYVSGTTTGVLALVKRTSSAADKLAAMVTDPLITHADAARQRGLSILGAAGHKYAVSLELPVLTGIGQPGVLDVGQLVQVNAAQPWRARVRGVSVSAKQPTLRQTITCPMHPCR